MSKLPDFDGSWVPNTLPDFDSRTHNMVIGILDASQLERVAERYKITESELMKGCMKIGLLIHSLEERGKYIVAHIDKTGQRDPVILELLEPKSDEELRDMGGRRFQLEIPRELADTLMDIANERQTTTDILTASMVGTGLQMLNGIMSGTNRYFFVSQSGEQEIDASSFV